MKLLDELIYGHCHRGILYMVRQFKRNLSPFYWSWFRCLMHGAARLTPSHIFGHPHLGDVILGNFPGKFRKLRFELRQRHAFWIK